VCELEPSNEEGKARYGAVKNTTRRVVTPRKQANNVMAYDTKINKNRGDVF
jgi:hypothetical protein